MKKLDKIITAIVLSAGMMFSSGINAYAESETAQPASPSAIAETAAQPSAESTSSSASTEQPEEKATTDPAESNAPAVTEVPVETTHADTPNTYSKIAPRMVRKQVQRPSATASPSSQAVKKITSPAPSASSKASASTVPSHTQKTTAKPNATITPKATSRPTTGSTSRPTVKPAPAATPKPKATSTPKPGSTSKASATPKPTATATPTSTPKPTATPVSGDPNDTSSDGAKPINMYRLYNPNSGEHFYTANTSERDHLKSLGWGYEGVGWVAPSKGKPVYRLYNKNGGEHHYTLSVSERNHLVSVGWHYEGTGWYSDTLQRTSVYREYNPNAFSCNHNFTTSKHEHDGLIALGWRNEGIAFYAMKEGKTIRYIPPKPVLPKEKFYNHGNIPVFKQNDPRWANVRIGGYPIKNTGCMPTSIAMAVSAIKYTTVTPVQVASYLHDHSDSFNVINHGGNAKSAEVAAEHWGITWEGITSADQMADALKHGKLVVMQVGPGDFTLPGYSHAIMLAGNSNGITSVFDPGAPNRAFNLYSIWNQRSTVPYDLIGGYAGVAMYQK